MYFHPNVGGEHSDDGANGCKHGHGQGRTHGFYRLLHTLRHTWQGVVIEEVVLGESLVKLVGTPLLLLAALAFHLLLPDGKQHILQTLWHLGAFLAKGVVDAGELLGLGETVVAGNHAVE